MVRGDIPIGDQSAQTIHASRESAWLATPSTGTHAVALTAKDERQLLELALRLRRARIPFVLIREPDAPYLNDATAIGIAPCARRAVDRLVSRFRLVGDPGHGPSGAPPAPDDGAGPDHHLNEGEGT